LIQDALSETGQAGAGGEAPHHIVVVEDDAPLRALLGRLLRECGYEVTGLGNAAALRTMLAEPNAQRIDLILLDIMMPGEDGLSLCSALRETSSVPIILVSARGQESDRVTGLDSGADDYIAKPFGRPELLARVRAALRRAAVSSAAPARKPAPTWLHFGDWRYNIRRRELFAPNDVQVFLTSAEHELLQALLRNPNRTIGRERLLELSRHRIGNETDRSIDVLVSRLRGKMGGPRRVGHIIRTVRGVGYMFAADVVPA